MIRALSFAAFAAVLALPVAAQDRIVSAGGSVTEIIYALGQQDRRVARDTTSNHPPQVHELPDVGYIRRLSPEGVLSVNPDMIIAEDGAGPPEALDVLNESAIPVVSIPMGFDRAAVEAKIIAVADALGVSEDGAALAAKVTGEIDAATADLGGTSPKVLFILTMQGGRIMAAGADTAADGIITLAGGTNASTGFEGYKPISDEAVLTAAPDIILVMDRGGARGMSNEDILANPALAVTTAGQAGHIIRMDGMLLLGFSVRTGEAVTKLAAAFQNTGS
jgi:iron complex transport system substrate-binding protein